MVLLKIYINFLIKTEKEIHEDIIKMYEDATKLKLKEFEYLKHEDHEFFNVM